MPGRAIIVGMGNACLDQVLELEGFPAAGEKGELGGAPRARPGGQVAGTLVGCARLGLEARFLLRCGDDAAGDAIRCALLADGVDLRFGRVLAGIASARAFILLNTAGERIVLWHTPDGLAVGADEISPEVLAGADVLFFDGRDGAACLRAAQIATQLGIGVVADLDCRYAHTDELLGWIDHLVVPASFGPGFGRVATVVTHGARGAEGWERGGGRVFAPGFAVPVVDSTGAGDAFHAGYIYGLTQGWDLAERMRFGNACGALACGGLGAQAGLPDLAEVENFLAERRG